MKVTRISEFGTQLTRLGLMNAYLVRESDGFTLVDTMIGGSGKQILAAAAQAGSPIKRILLTHAHVDHIGSLDELAKDLGGAPGSTAALAELGVAIGARESRLLQKPPDKTLEPNEPQCKVKGGLPGATTHATHVLMEGELYGSLRCLSTPGHTPGHFSYLDERDGTFYAGDALLTVGGKPLIPGFGPWYFPFPNFATWHRPTAMESIQRLLDDPLPRPIERIAPGHGPVLEGGSDLLRAALSRT